MKKCILILASALLLTGCSGSASSENAPDAVQSGNAQTSEAATEEITAGYVTYEVPDTNKEPAIADDNSTFYRYAGKRWWVNRDEPAAEFVLRDGEYAPFFDYEHDPAAGAGLEQGFAIYPTVESFNEGGWKYIGTLKLGDWDNQRHFYFSPDGETILQFYEDDGYAETADDEKLFTVSILTASVV